MACSLPIILFTRCDFSWRLENMRHNYCFVWGVIELYYNSSNLWSLINRHLFLYANIWSVGPTTMMSEGTRNILEAMKARGICKVIGCMSGMTHLCVLNTLFNTNCTVSPYVIFVHSVFAVGTRKGSSSPGSCHWRSWAHAHLAEGVWIGLCSGVASTHRR